MEIVVREIPEEGLHLKLDTRKTVWFREILADSLLDARRDDDSGEAELFLHRTGQNVDCHGMVAFECHPVCSLCLKEFPRHVSMPIHFTAAPFYESDREMSREEEAEVELLAEDLEFSYYKGDRFDLGELLREQIILEMPMKPVCRTDCKGLCPQCGKDLNAGTCHCKEPHPASPFAVLKGFKPARKRARK